MTRIRCVHKEIRSKYSIAYKNEPIWRHCRTLCALYLNHIICLNSFKSINKLFWRKKKFFLFWYLKFPSEIKMQMISIYSKRREKTPKIVRVVSLKSMRYLYTARIKCKQKWNDQLSHMPIGILVWMHKCIHKTHHVEFGLKKHKRHRLFFLLSQ